MVSRSRRPSSVLSHLAVVAQLTLLACSEATPTTGVTLTISVLAQGIQFDELRISAEIDGEEPLEQRRALGRHSAESESVNLFFDREAGGKEVTLIAEAFAAGSSVLTGRTKVRLKRDEFVTAELRMLDCAAPDGAFCDGGTLVDCDAARANTIRTACSFGCNAEAGRCNECAPDTTSCEGDTFVRCGADGTRLSTEDCAQQGDPCRAGSCTPGGCAMLPANEGLACDDGRFCTENTTCSAGSCGGGTPRSCDDDNACTFDTCDEATDTCVPDAAANDGLPCQSPDFCVVQQTCNGGVCGGGVARTCDDSNPCTVDGCDELADACTHQDKIDGTPCEDGAFCTLGDSCQTGQCQPGAAVPCTDANPCTVDSCDEDNDACIYAFAEPGTRCVDAVTATSCDGSGGAAGFICAFGCNTDRDECNECDPDPARIVTCRADIENLCNAEFVCSGDGLVVFKSCCASNQCACDGVQCLEGICDTAPDVSAGGVFAGDTCDDDDNVPGDCYPGGLACQSTADGASPEEFFRVSLDDGTSRSAFYNIVLDSTASATATDLRLSTVCGNESLQIPNAEVCALPASNDGARACLQATGADLMVLCGLPEGDYYGAVESEGGTCGAYSLDVSVTQATLDDGTQAGNISRGGVFTGSTCGLADDFSFPNVSSISGCDGVANCAGGVCPSCSAGAATDCRVSSLDSLCSHSGAGGPDAVFYLALTVDSGVDISTQGSQFDTVLYLMEAGAGGLVEPGEVRLCNDDCFGSDGASHIQTSLPAGLYYVLLDGAAGDCGNYVLTVTVSPAATCPNLSCESPFETCATCPGDCRCQRCGDGALQPAEGEQCDDDDTDAGDGCSELCVVEPGFKCSGAPSVCVPACGDGVLDLDRGEECDDGNAEGGDGCDAACAVEASFICGGEPSFCSPGVRVSACPEAAVPVDSTWLTATLDVPGSFTLYDVTLDLAVTHPWIGDLYVELVSPAGTTVRVHDASGGSSDDIVGNYDLTLTPDGPGTMNDFDGQPGNGTWTIRLYDTYPSADSGTLDCWTLNLRAIAVCGNGSCEAGQENCASCASDCPCTNCGNGVVQTGQGELCDDGDTSNTDGCSDECVVESGYKCSGNPSVCVLACGDGIIDAGMGETCDDGDRDPGDGCSGTCTREADFLCAGEPSVCVPGAQVSACPGAAIPDNSPTGINDVISVSTACTIKNITVDVNIRHPYIGDLTVDLRAPNNKTLRLHDRTGSSTDDIVGNYDLTLTPSGGGGMDTFNGDPSNGNWRLTVADRATSDTGTLQCWGVNIECQ